MISNLTRWVGATLVAAGISIAAGTAHGQDLGGDLNQLQRDQWQARRDYNQLQRDLATGNAWGVQRDLNNLQQDRRDLCQDRQNLRPDLQYITGAPAGYYGGGYPASAYPSAPVGYPGGLYPQPGQVYPNAVPTYPQANPYGYNPYRGGYPSAPGYRPW